MTTGERRSGMAEYGATPEAKDGSNAAQGRAGTEVHRPRSIVYVLPYLEAGGTERHVLHLIRRFREQARIGLLAPSGPLLPEFLNLGVMHCEFPRLEHNFIGGVKRLREGARALVDALGPDVIHVHAAPELALLIRGAVRRSGGAASVLTLHGFAVSNPRANFKIANMLARLGRVDRIITVSEAEAHMLRDAGCSPGRMTVVYNGIPDVWHGERDGVDTAGGFDGKVSVGAEPGIDGDFGFEAVPGSASGVPIVGAVGRLERVKGFDVLLEAFAELGARASLVIVGDGSERETLERQSVALGVANRVHFVGFVPDAERVPAGFDVMVVPSRQEAIGMVALEAMAAGTPVVASNVGGLPEAVDHGVTGLIVPPDNVGALAGAIRSLLDDGPRAREMGARGRERFLRKFHVDTMAEQTWAVYEEVVR